MSRAGQGTGKGGDPIRLHVYDHCPYCTRARMPFGLKGIPFELKILANDDEETPRRMVGRKVAPILEDADGFMPESLDIVRKLDARDSQPLFAGEPRPEIVAWLEAWHVTMRTLGVPHTPDPVYPEFATQSARDYYTAQKEGMFGKFADLRAQADRLLPELARGLRDLVPILPDPERPTIDDILLFPHLRSLTNLPHVTLPPAVRAYCERMAERSGVPLVDQLRATT